MRHTVNSRGMPEGWRTYETVGGHPAYDFTVVEDEGRQALHLRSQSDHSTIARKLRVNLWPRTPALLRSRLIGYVWDRLLPVGTVQKSQKTGTVTFVVVRSGASHMGRWLTERRNVAEDFRSIYGEEPESPGAVARKASSAKCCFAAMPDRIRTEEA
jgi:hypothetical protein